MNPAYRIVFEPAASRRASRWVVRGFFAPRELPQAVLRAFLTPELYVFIGAPVALIAASWLLPEAWELTWAVPPRTAATVLALAWLAAGAVHLLTLGRSAAIAALAEDGTLAGALRLKIGRRRIWFAGILIDPAHRRRGLFAALLLAAFRLARDAGRPLELSIFAPSHPASRHVTRAYFDGRKRLRVDASPGTPFTATLERLEREVAALPGRDVDVRFELSGAL